MGTLNFMVNILFMVFGMFVPAFIYLLTLGHLVYSLGEYHEQNNKIPHILMLLMFKLFLIGIILYSIYSWHFINETASLTMFLWGNMISFDCYYINKMLAHIDNYGDLKINFRRYLLAKVKRDITINGCQNWFFLVKLCFVLMLFFVLVWYYSNGVQVIITDICLPLYVYYDIRLFNYYEKFIVRHDLNS